MPPVRPSPNQAFPSLGKAKLDFAVRPLVSAMPSAWTNGMGGLDFSSRSSPRYHADAFFAHFLLLSIGTMRCIRPTRTNRFRNLGTHPPRPFFPDAGQVLPERKRDAWPSENLTEYPYPACLACALPAEASGKAKTSGGQPPLPHETCLQRGAPVCLLARCAQASVRTRTGRPRRQGGKDGRVEKWRGGLGAAYLFPPLSSNGASIAAPCSVSTSRSSVGSRAGAPSVGSGGHSTAFAMGLSPAPVVTFPTPATSNPACRLPAPGFPADFLSRVMGPMVPEWLSARGRQPDTQKTVRVLCITTAYSTASSQNPDLCARASDGA